MTIEVSYEPRHIFDDRIKNKYQNIIYLDEFNLSWWRTKRKFINR